MLSNLEQIRQEALKVNTKINTIRNGSERKGHWRHYHDHSIWIEAMDIAAHNVVRTKMV
jgi:hypothetical protein